MFLFEFLLTVLLLIKIKIVFSFAKRLVVGQYVGVGGSVVSHVNVTDVRSTDGGSYTCIATNRAGSTSHTARLNVYGKFTFHNHIFVE